MKQLNFLQSSSLPLEALSTLEHNMAYRQSLRLWLERGIRFYRATQLLMDSWWHHHLQQQHLWSCFSFYSSAQIWTLPLTLTNDKCTFVQLKVTFASLQLSAQGCQIEKSIVEVISQYPIPLSRTDIQFFYWMGNIIDMKYVVLHSWA